MATTGEGAHRERIDTDRYYRFRDFENIFFTYGTYATTYTGLKLKKYDLDLAISTELTSTSMGPASQ